MNESGCSGGAGVSTSTVLDACCIGGAPETGSAHRPGTHSGRIAIPIVHPHRRQVEGGLGPGPDRNLGYLVAHRHPIAPHRHPTTHQ